MESCSDLRRPNYKTMDHFISQQTSPDWANKKLENSKWELLSDDPKHYLNSMKANSKNVIQKGFINSNNLEVSIFEIF